MFLEIANKPNNHFLKYLLGSFLVIIASTIGQLPLFIAVALKLYDNENDFPKIDQIALTQTLDKNTTLFLILFSFLFALIGIFIVLKLLHKQSIKTIITTRNKIDINRILFSFGIWSVFIIITTIISYYINPKDYVLIFDPYNFLILAIISILLIPVQTSVEELIFRGYLMQGFGLLSKNRFFPLLLTSLIFGLMHIANPEIEKMGYIALVYYIGTGLFLGILTLMDEGLELSLGFHAANNLVGALLITSDWSAFQTNSILKDISEPEVGFEIILPVVIIFPILLFIFSKKYNWHNWKEKLTGEQNNNIQEIDN